eukprot:gene1930-1169_t
MELKISRQSCTASPYPSFISSITVSVVRERSLSSPLSSLFSSLFSLYCSFLWKKKCAEGGSDISTFIFPCAEDHIKSYRCGR